MLILPWFLIYALRVYTEPVVHVFAFTFYSGAGFAHYLGLGEPWGWLFSLLLSTILAFSVWYLVARLWLMSSRHFKFSVLGIGIFAVLTAWAIRQYQDHTDWTSRGLNPSRPGFRPQVVILAGTIDYWINDTAVNQIKSGSALFEIRMRGFDHYYCKKWQGSQWKGGSWFRVELAVKDFSETWGLSRFAHRTRGGGGGWFGPNDIILARRLWSGDKFVGASPATLTAETQQWSRKEEFMDLMRIGPYQIPRKIRLTERGNREETYTIRKVEFTTQPTDDWYVKVRQKYFDREPTLQNVDLDEPGVLPTSR
jgi:hypothetical protein